MHARAFLHACLGVRATSSAWPRARVRSVVKNHRKLGMPVSFPSTSIAAAAAVAATTETTKTMTTSATPPFSSPFSRQPATYCAPSRLSRTVPETEGRSLEYSGYIGTASLADYCLRLVQDGNVAMESREG